MVIASISSGGEGTSSKLKDVRTIQCSDFLDVIGLPQYAETFQKNIGLVGGFLNRDKLEGIKMQHLGQMNITQHDHMKAIMGRIKDLRRGTAQDLRLQDQVPGKSLDDLLKAPTVVQRSLPCKIKAYDENGNLIDYKTQLGRKTGFVKASDRRSTFTQSLSAAANDNARRLSQIVPIGLEVRRSSVNSTNNNNYKPENPPLSRTNAGGASQQQEESAGGQQQPQQANRNAAGGGFSFQNHDEKRLASARETRMISQGYGNQALRTSTIEQGLKVLTKQVVDKFREVVGCDRATILYNDTSSDELVFFVDDQCIRFPNVTGIAGYCLQTGESLNIEDAYQDPRFNPEVDRKTGYRTHNILARPIYARFGGNIIAVVEMINKLDRTSFSKQDEEVLESCCLGVCDALESQFTDLLTSMTALNRHRGKTANVLGSAITKDIKDLSALHDAFLAKLEGRVVHSGNDSRYMKLNEPSNQMTTELQKRKRRVQYAENLRTIHASEVESQPSSSTKNSHGSSGMR